MVERINRAVADCLILCAYSQRDPREAAQEYLASLRRDPTWDEQDASSVESLVMGVLARLARSDVNSKGWLK